MLRAKKLLGRAKSFERLVGLSPAQFEQVLSDLQPLWNRAHRRSLLRVGRVRAIGGGRSFKLALSEGFIPAQHFLGFVQLAYILILLHRISGQPR